MQNIRCGWTCGYRIAKVTDNNLTHNVSDKHTNTNKSETQFHVNQGTEAVRSTERTKKRGIQRFKEKVAKIALHESPN